MREKGGRIRLAQKFEDNEGLNCGRATRRKAGSRLEGGSAGWVGEVIGGVRGSGARWRLTRDPRRRLTGPVRISKPSNWYNINPRSGFTDVRSSELSRGIS